MTTPVTITSPQIVVTNTGQRGNTWLSGAGAPANSLGMDGDFYLDTTNVGIFYGPKSGGVWGGSHAFATPLTNFSSVNDPLASNDGTQGYTRGSVWINTVKNLYYVCTQNTTNAAVWVQAIPSTATASGDLSGPLLAPTVSKINGVSVSGTPIVGQSLFATSPTAAAWQPGKNYSTSLLSGCVMSPNTATSFNLSVGTGVICDYVTNPSSPTVTFVTIPAQVVTLTGSALTRVVTWWVSDANGNITGQATQPTPTQRRSVIQIGVTALTAGSLDNIISVPNYAPQHINQLYDSMFALGTFVSAGNKVSANGANLRFNLSSGTLFSPSFNYTVDNNNPHQITTVAETPVSFFYGTQLANSEVVATAIDPTKFDVGGVLTTVGGGTGTSTVHRVYLFGTRTAGTQIAVQYDQTTYSTLSAAVASTGNFNGFVVNPDFSNGGTLIAYICVTRICASLSDTGNCTIISAPKFAVP